MSKPGGHNGSGRAEKLPDWLHRFDLDGYEFHVLLTADAFIEEGRQMHHCVAGRYQRSARGHWYFSIRKNGRRVATAEFDNKFVLTEIKALQNKAPEQGAVAAANRVRGFVENGPPKEEKPSSEPKALSAPEPTRTITSSLKALAQQGKELVFNSTTWTGAT